MILVRLKKVLSSNVLSYVIVVTTSTSAVKSNKALEVLGFYKPINDVWANKYVFINLDNLLFWLKKGAKIHYSVLVIIKPLLTNLKKKTLN